MSEGAYWGVRVPTGVRVWLLVSEGAYWHLLLSECAYWCLWGLLVSECGYWCLRVPTGTYCCLSVPTGVCGAYLYLRVTTGV